MNRRLLLDMHVPDWDPRFLAEFDPRAAARAARAAHIGHLIFDANSHSGLAYWPSSVGRRHAVAADRDLFGEMVSAARMEGLQASAYYCTVYVDWYWDEHPEARIVDASGISRRLDVRSAGHPRRWSICCFNEPGYRKFVLEQVAELAVGYPLDGFWLDMAFWPTVCYCVACEHRNVTESGGSIPRVVNWTDPAWTGFAARRRRWLVEFARELRLTIERIRPDATVVHQSQLYAEEWIRGGSTAMASETAFLSADQYRDRDSLTFNYKLFRALSQHPPFEQLGSWCYPNIREHVVLQTREELAVAAYLPLINGGAAGFVEAVDPSGRIYSAAFERVAPLLAQVERLEPFIGGVPCQDVGVYVSYEASFDLRHDGRPVADVGYSGEPDVLASHSSAHRPAAIAAGRALRRAHLTYGVLTRNDLGRLADWTVIVLPNVVMLDQAELDAFRAYVRQGGRLYASKMTSLLDTDGRRRADFGLADLFGCRLAGESSELLTYMRPTPIGGALLDPYTEQRPLTLHDTQALVAVQTPEADVLAQLTLPWTDPRGERYASILTDPPGEGTAYPSIILHPFGAGLVAYAAGVLEAEEHASQRAVFMRLIEQMLPIRPSIELEAPASVEVTMFDQPKHGRLLVWLLNAQPELPNIPVPGLRLRIATRGRHVSGVASIPDGQPLAWVEHDDHVEVALPALETLLAVRLSYRHSLDQAPG